MEGSEGSLAERWFVKALGHPVRVQILELLNEREASPTELRRRLGGTLNLINYHLNVLRECECVEISRTEPVKGAVKHFYRAVPRPFLAPEDLRDVPASIRGGAAEASLRGFWRIFRHAAQAGAIDREETILTWMSLALDETGRNEVAELTAAHLSSCQRIAAESKQRAAEEGAALRPAIVAHASFEAAGGGNRPSG